MSADPIVVWGVRTAFVLLSLALIATVARLVKGPTTPDRVVALDLVATLVIGFVAASTVLSGDEVFLRIAVVVALISFLGTAAVADYLERQGEE